MKRKFVAAISAIGLALSITAVSVPANAAVCARLDHIDWHLHYASTIDSNGQCGTVGVRALFTPPGTSTTVNTGWIYGPDVARTTTIKNIGQSFHTNF